MYQFMRLAYAIVIFLASGLIALTALAQSNQEQLNVPDIEFERDVIYVKTQYDSHYFNVELANDPMKRQRGLMYRQVMADDAGMLFLFSDERQRSFWMKNTYIPLDIIYISRNGEIVSIAKHTKPHDETPVPSYLPATYVLEVNAGITDRLDIQEGDLLCHPTVELNPNC